MRACVERARWCAPETALLLRPRADTNAPDRREANWTRRQDIVNYCVGVVDESLEAQRLSVADAGEDASARRRAKGALYAEEVKVRRPCTLLCACDAAH